MVVVDGVAAGEEPGSAELALGVLAGGTGLVVPASGFRLLVSVCDAVPAAVAGVWAIG